MNNEFVTYDIAVALKEIGFDEPCMGFFNGYDITIQSYNNKPAMHRNTFLSVKDKGEMFVLTPEPLDADTNPDYVRLKWGMKITAPTYQSVLKWFRDKHDLPSTVYPVWKENDPKDYYDFEFWSNEGPFWEDEQFFETYEEAQTALIWKLIEEIKKI